MSPKAKVYLIPSLLDEEAIETIPASIIHAVKECQVFFVENERSARRYLKKIWKEMIIDNYEWYKMSDDKEMAEMYRQKLTDGKTIGIISEAGCPGVADPGQSFVAMAHERNIEVKPLVGPNSLLLALMASGMNGQRFQFVGYLPIDNPNRARAIKELEAESQQKNCTQLFIETPYRNNQLLDALLKTCKPSTQLCVAANLTSAKEYIRTSSMAEWKQNKPDLHKQPVIFCLLAAGN
jgi:16S rRNA (cytidine1402-2'-O)-methyltransferase